MFFGFGSLVHERSTWFFKFRQVCVRMPGGFVFLCMRASHWLCGLVVDWLVFAGIDWCVFGDLDWLVLCGGVIGCL